MGTIGGNLCTASPAGDTLPPLYVLGAQLELRAPAGVRRMPIDEWMSGPGRNALGKGELLYGVRVPKTSAGGLQHFEKVGLRKALAIAVASLAARLSLSPDGIIEDARFAWGSVGPVIVTCGEIERAAHRPAARREDDPRSGTGRDAGRVANRRRPRKRRIPETGGRESAVSSSRISHPARPDRGGSPISDMEQPQDLFNRRFIALNVILFFASVTTAAFFQFHDYLSRLHIAPGWFGLIIGADSVASLLLQPVSALT